MSININLKKKQKLIRIIIEKLSCEMLIGQRVHFEKKMDKKSGFIFLLSDKKSENIIKIFY